MKKMYNNAVTENVTLKIRCQHMDDIGVTLFGKICTLKPIFKL